MKIIFDIEANEIRNPTEVWLVVCKDLMTGRLVVFRNLTSDANERVKFLKFAEQVELWIGHNVLQYDLPVLEKLVGLPPVSPDIVLDTFILSKLIDYPRDKHGVESYGEEFGLLKGFKVETGEVLEAKHFPPSFFQQYSKDLENYCIRDTEITYKIFNKYKKYIDNPEHTPSIQREHRFQLCVNSIHNNGFALDVKKAKGLLQTVETELTLLDRDILDAFPPKFKFIREIHPKATKFGTISLTSIPKSFRGNLHEFTVDAPFSYGSWVEFNPASHKQIIEVLNRSRWQPVDKTDTHKDTERELNRLRRIRKRSAELDLETQACQNKLLKLGIYGWKINENNLSTLPASAPSPARLLARRILYEARRRTLTEKINLVQADGRVHGEFQGIGAWTHRMAHQKPNMANVANAVRVSDGKPSLLGKELRSCWIAPKGRLLVGVDAEAIQLRIFAHMINDPVLIDAIVNGDKKKGTDPHSLNKTYFGSFCKTRNAAKHSLYAMFFGGGPGMLAHIMGCTKEEASIAISALTEKYPGLRRLQEEVFPIDARRGYFIGLDGRKVRIPGDTIGQRQHLCMSGYLQNGEKVIMSEATIRFEPELKNYDTLLVNLVHDEWQNECPNDLQTCIAVADLECEALVRVGKQLRLNCPLAGSYRNDEGNFTFGRTWYETH